MVWTPSAFCPIDSLFFTCRHCNKPNSNYTGKNYLFLSDLYLCTGFLFWHGSNRSPRSTTSSLNCFPVYFDNLNCSFCPAIKFKIKGKKSELSEAEPKVLFDAISEIIMNNNRETFVFIIYKFCYLLNDSL